MSARVDTVTALYAGSMVASATIWTGNPYPEVRRTSFEKYLRVVDHWTDSREPSPTIIFIPEDGVVEGCTIYSRLMRAGWPVIAISRWGQALPPASAMRTFVKGPASRQNCSPEELMIAAYLSSRSAPHLARQIESDYLAQAMGT